jgi:nucleoside-diphosphate-sugar epimerase
MKADLERAEDAARACSGAGTVVCTVGVPYRSPIYTRVWPIVMRNLLDGCARSGARFVFADNLYMYGPQTEPLTEDMPLTDFGQKPRARAEITRLWQQAHGSGRVHATAVRASDFYGPDVATSVLSTFGVARLLAGKAALAPYPPDHLHAFTYVPDFARALVTLIDAPDYAYGEAWHVPNAPTETLRQLITLAAKLIGVRPRLMVLPQTLAPLIALFDADVRELAEMRFQWDRPYRVDSSKFAKRFWSDATPFEEGLTQTIDFYRRAHDTRHSHGG